MVKKPNRKSKNIIICCDGTGNEYGANNTNVVHAFEHLIRDENQVAFYDPGVGTFSFFGKVIGKKIGELLGKAFGYGLRQNIEDAYEYLMNRYLPGDRVYIYGFSRGAYTARSLAGMVSKLGILQKGSKNLIPYATTLYMENKDPDVIKGFKKTYCHECNPFFVGVWDTVGSFGFITKNKFKNFDLDARVKNAFHAMAIDEKRKKFPVTAWNESTKVPGQVIEQAWFAGVHSDVGGWYTERGLSNIALLWMLENSAKRGLRLKPGWQKEIVPDEKDVMHESYSGFWRLWPPAPRKIPSGSKIHNSVFLRMKSNPEYKPDLPKNRTIVK